MAEQPNGGSHPQTPVQSHPATAKKSNMYIAAATEDDRLEPDALRGSEFLTQQVKDAGVEDLEAERVKKLKDAEKRAG